MLQCSAKQREGFVRRALTSLGLAFGLSASPLWSGPAGRAHTGPITPNLVTFSVIADGGTATVMIREGELARIGSGATTYGFAAVLQPDEEAAQVFVFEIIPLDGGGEALVQRGKVVIAKNGAARVEGAPLSLRLLQLDRLSAAPPPFGPPAEPDCCVFCGGIWACANCVRTECGCCCDPTYCETPGCKRVCLIAPG